MNMKPKAMSRDKVGMWSMQGSPLVSYNDLRPHRLLRLFISLWSAICLFDDSVNYAFNAWEKIYLVTEKYVKYNLWGPVWSRKLFKSILLSRPTTTTGA